MLRASKSYPLIHKRFGNLPGFKKLFLGFSGIHSDEKLGIQQLEMAAKSGQCLRPFAKIMLALAALREEKPEVARIQLKELVAEFPENSLFANELAKLGVPPDSASHCTRASAGSIILPGGLQLKSSRSSSLSA